MTPALASLLSLAVAIVLSCTSRVNVGLLALPMAWAVGLYAGSTTDVLVSRFPTSLFITLAGVTLLFALSEVNGTVDSLARLALRAARGSARLVPLLFFAITCVLASVGPGSIASVALVIPMATAVGGRAGVPAFLTALMVANGANAGNLSPFSSVGVIANAKMAEVGLAGFEGKVWAANFLAHLLVSLVAYLALGGWALKGKAGTAVDPKDAEGLSGRQWVTAAIITAWIVGVIWLSLPLGHAAFAGALLLILAGAADERTAIARMPWGIILMVTGMSVLVGVLEQTGGLALFTGMLAKLATPGTLNGVIAFVTGLISTYSSTSGVVLPTFLPTVPGLVEQVGGGDPLAVALSINVGSALVDVSPLSTLGALAVAALADPEAGRELFRKLMIWGLSMSVVGALLCQLLAGPFARL